MPINWQKELNANIIRQALASVRNERLAAENEIISDAVAYFNKTGDLDLIKQKLKERYATGIGKRADDNDADQGTAHETYIKGKASDAIDMGQVESISAGFAGRIAGALTIFDSKTQSWDYLRDGDESGETAEDIAGEVERQRELGGFEPAMQTADILACGIESGLVYISWSNGHLTYTPLSPSCILPLYAEAVDDNGKVRGADPRSIEDLYGVVITLSDNTGSGSGAADKRRYLAILGRSLDWPLGRHVTYESSNPRDIPSVGSPGAIDYVTNGGEIANPLSLANQESGGALGVEYPIICIRGGHVMLSDNPFPTFSSLYETSVEIDAAVSRALFTGALSARGIIAVTSERHQTLPPSLEGNVALLGGQTIQVLGRDSKNTLDYMQVTENAASSAASGYGVPGFTVLGNVQSGVESGVALAIRSAPLMETRERRAKINRPVVARLFAIERGLYKTHTNPQVELAGEDINQVWSVGRFILPESDTEKLQRLKDAKDAGFMSHVRAVRDYYNLPTDKHAIDMINKMEEQDAENPGKQPITAAPGRGVGLGIGSMRNGAGAPPTPPPRGGEPNPRR